MLNPYQVLDEAYIDWLWMGKKEKKRVPLFGNRSRALVSMQYDRLNVLKTTIRLQTQTEVIKFCSIGMYTKSTLSVNFQRSLGLDIWCFVIFHSLCVDLYVVLPMHFLRKTVERSERFFMDAVFFSLGPSKCLCKRLKIELSLLLLENETILLLKYF